MYEEPTNMVDAIRILNDEQINFILEECKLTNEELYNLDEDSINERVYEVMCEIEIDTTLEAGDGELSERGLLSESIVTILGNTLIPEIEKLWENEDMVKNGKICPVCGKYQFYEPDFYEICPVCGWEDDPLQRDEPNFEGGANELSLNQFKKEYEKE